MVEMYRVLNQEPLEKSIANRVGEDVLYESEPDWAGRCAETANTTLYWDSEMGVWLAKIEGEFLESSWDKDTGGPLHLPYTGGPFILNLPACKKILEAYGISGSGVDLESVSRMSPSTLEKLALQK